MPAMKTDMRAPLYHVTVTISCRDEYPGARSEQRTYTPRGARNLGKRLAWLTERYPGCPIKISMPGPASRAPVC